jgi:hypothetical protein
MEKEVTKGATAGIGRLRSLGVVRVTQAIIDTALPANSGHCMVSDAVMAAAKARGWRIRKVLTDLQTVRFSDSKTKVRYVCFTPRVAQLALLAFDQGVRPEPIEFRLRPVQVITPSPTKPRAKARVAMRPSGGTHGGHTRPIKHGGPQLPTTIGLRREFGLRQMGVYQAPAEPAVA